MEFGKFFKSKGPYEQLLILVGLIFISFGVIGGLVIKGYLTELSSLSNGKLLSETINFSPELINLYRIIQTWQSIFLFIIPPVVFSFLIKPENGLAEQLKLSGKGFNKTNFYLFTSLAIIGTLCFIPIVNLLGFYNEHINFNFLGDSFNNWIHQAEQAAMGISNAMIGEKSGTSLVLNLIILALIPAVGEEFLFRGTLQPLFTRWWNKPVLALVLTSILFSAFHIQFLGFFPRLVLGLWLGVLFQWSGKLWPGIIAHFFNNALVVLGSYWGIEELESSSALPNWISLLVAALALGWILRKLKSLKIQN